jgi:GDPmannose 4,6-dehydratase
LRFLEAIRSCGLSETVKFYQASTSELYGLVQEVPQKETTPFYPRSPYGVAKLYGYWIVKNYREAYGLHASSGILFNHESPRRGETFVTKKITKGLSRIKRGMQEKITLGNIYAKRDWGHAKDFCNAMWLILQQEKPDDYVISTDQQVSVKDFINMCLEILDFSVEWKGEGINEVCIDTKTGKVIIDISKKYFRPSEVETLLGDSTKARKQLNWKPTYNLKDLAKEMIEYDLEEIK